MLGLSIALLPIIIILVFLIVHASIQIIVEDGWLWFFGGVGSIIFMLACIFGGVMLIKNEWNVKKIRKDVQ